MKARTRISLLLLSLGAWYFTATQSHSPSRLLAHAEVERAESEDLESTTTGNPRVEPSRKKEMARGERKRKAALRPVDPQAVAPADVASLSPDGLPFEVESFLAATLDPVNRERWRKFLSWHRSQPQPVDWSTAPAEVADGLLGNPHVAKQVLVEAFQTLNETLNETLNSNNGLKTALFDFASQVQGGPSSSLSAYALRTLDTPRGFTDPVLSQAAAAAYINLSPDDAQTTYDNLLNTQAYQQNPGLEKKAQKDLEKKYHVPPGQLKKQ